MVKKEKHYITQPYQLTTLKGDMKLNQVRVLIEMMDLFGDRVEDMFNERKTYSMSLFDGMFDDKGDIVIDIPMKSIANSSKIYDDIEKMADEIASFKIKSNEVSEDGITYKVTNVFTSVEVPKSANNRRNSVRVKMSVTQAETLFNYKRYSVYLKAVAKEAKSVYTSRLYMLLTSERFKGTWTVTYKDLRDILGCNKYSGSVMQERYITEKKYTEYRNFKTRVLDVASDELKALADENKTNCYFTYEAIYAPGVNPTLRNDPEKIRFTIIDTEMGMLEDRRKKESMARIEIEETLRSTFNLKPTDCTQICKMLGDTDTASFIEKIKAIKKTVDGKKDIENYTAYVMQALRTAIAELTPIAEEVHEEPKEEPETVQTIDTKMQSAFDAILAKVDKTWHKAITLRGVSDEYITLSMPSKSTFDAFYNSGGKTFFDELQKKFKRQIKMEYDIR